MGDNGGKFTLIDIPLIENIVSFGVYTIREHYS